MKSTVDIAALDPGHSLEVILTLRTDNPEAEIGLYDVHEQIAYHKWQAHRELSNTIHTQVEQLLAAQQKTWQNITAIVAYEGPGSFTGLRIGLSVANALAYSLKLPIVASKGENWIETGINRLQSGEQDDIALPLYGGDANITAPRR